MGPFCLCIPKKLQTWSRYVKVRRRRDLTTSFRSRCVLLKSGRGSRPCFKRRVVRKGVSKPRPLQVTIRSQAASRLRSLTRRPFSWAVLLASKYSLLPVSGRRPTPTTMPASASREEVSMSRITILGAMGIDDSGLV